MKTFKLVSLTIETEDQLEEIVLNDGLIISQENAKGTWIIEAYCARRHLNFFQSQLYEGNDIDAHVIITKPDNNPATFKSQIISIRPLDQGISVLLQGELRQNNNDYAERVLSELIDTGLAGDDLLKAFRKTIKQRKK